jgi:hypothetical protein
VAQWVRSLSPVFGPYAAAFERHSVQGHTLPLLTDALLATELSVTNPLHRVQLLSSIAALKGR